MPTIQACTVVVSLMFCSLLLPVQAADADLAAGKTKAAMCGACHGAEGISNLAEYPNLAGQKPQYLVNALKAYRDGSRTNQIMVPMANGLSDQDIQDLAAYFASLPGAGGQSAQSGN